MLRTVLRKIRRDIWSRKTRTALVSLSIFIGVFGTITLFTMGDLLVRQLESDLKEDELAMTRVFLRPKAGVTDIDDAAFLELIETEVSQVAIAEGQTLGTIYWKKPNAREFEVATGVSYSKPYGEVQLEPVRLVTGDYPQALGQIAIEKRFADEHGIQLGDQLTLQILSQSNTDIETIPEETWSVVGIVFQPYPLSSGFNPIVPETMIFTTYDAARYITNAPGFTTVYVRYTDYIYAEESAELLEATIASQTPYSPIFKYSDNPAENGLIEFIKTINGVLASLGILAIIVSGFLVVNVINSIVLEQKRQIGVMKSLGATRGENGLIYTGMAFVYGLIGVIPAVPLGIIFGFYSAQGLAASANSLIEDFDVSIRAILIGIGMGLVVPIFAALIPVLNGTRVTILEAITDLGISSDYGRGPLTRLLHALPIPIAVRQGLGTLIQKKGRVIFTMATLTMAAGSFMGVFAVFASIDKVVDGFFNTFQLDMVINPTNSDDLTTVESIILQDNDDLTRRGFYISSEVEIVGFDKEFDPNSGPPALFAQGYDPNFETFQFTVVDGDTLRPDSTGVLISEIIANDLNKNAGQTIIIEAGDKSQSYVIEGIVDYPYEGVWFTWQTLALLLGNVDAAGDPIPAGLVFQLNQTDPTAAEVEDVVAEINQDLLRRGFTIQYENLQVSREAISQAVDTFRTLFNITAGLIALVGAVGLLTALSMSVFERQKEIGVMRSVGAPSFTIIAQFLTEGLVMGFIAWLVGLPMSYFIGSNLLELLNLGEAYAFEYPPETMVIGFIGTLILTTAASFYPSWAAGRKTVSDILRYQ